MDERLRDDSQSIDTAVKALGDAIKTHIARPIYLRVAMQNGELAIEQVEYLTTEEFAALAKVDLRTVYSWLDKGLLRFCKPQGTGQNLIPLRAALHWLDSSETVKAPKPKAQG